MDHGRVGPQGALGGGDGAPNIVEVFTATGRHVPPHLSKEQNIALTAGDRVRVRTPGGGGYGDPGMRPDADVARDVALEYFNADQAARLFRGGGTG